jgi:glycosyltransferase involved in cell wall biosynthesis
MVDILIPTMHAEDKLEKIVENVYKTANYPCKICFIAEAEDTKTIEKVKQLENVNLVVNTEKGGITHCFNVAYKQIDGEYFALMTDDLVFPDNWLKDAVEQLGSKSVLAFTDKNGLGWGFFLVRRSYIKNLSGVIDQPETIYHEYKHGYADAEFHHTARMRSEIIYSNIVLDHRDVKYLGARYKDDDGEYVMVRSFYIRDYAIPFSKIQVSIVPNLRCPQEKVIRVDLIPLNPVDVDKSRAFNVNKSYENMMIDKAEYEQRAHMWGGETVETVLTADDQVTRIEEYKQNACSMKGEI